MADVGKPGLRKLRAAQCGRDTDGGVFSLSKPTKGWPVGKYRVEIYVNDKLADTVKFTVKAGASQKESKESGG